MKNSTKPMSASASVNAIPRNMVVLTMPAASGCRAIALIAGDHEADADAWADRCKAVANQSDRTFDLFHCLPFLLLSAQDEQMSGHKPPIAA